MHPLILRLVWLVLTTSILAGCGGGGGTDPNVAPTASAGAAQSVLVGALVSLDGSASADPEKAALSYSWTLSSRPAGSAAALTGPTTARPTLSPDVEGSYVLALTVHDGQVASAPSTVTVTALPTSTLQIQADMSEPLAGSVQFTLSGPTAGAPVSWYVDLMQIGSARPATSVTWNSAGATNGTHLVTARVQVSASNSVEIRRTVSVANSPISFLSVTLPSFARPPFNVDVRVASLAASIASVSATLDGAPWGTLNSPSSSPDTYSFTFQVGSVASGSHTMVVTAIDQAGNSLQRTIPLDVSNPPGLVLAGPLDGAIVHGSLAVSGTTSTDRAGPVTVTVRLGQLQILQTTSPSFGTSYDLTGVPPGRYTLGVDAIDSTNASTSVLRTIIVASSPGLVHAPLFSLGTGGQLLAAEGDLVLYKADDQSVRLRNTVTATELSLQDTVLGNGNWWITAGRVVASGFGNDCSIGLGGTCIYEWNPDGTRRNLSVANPFAGTSTRQRPIVKDGFMVWCNCPNITSGGLGSYTVYNVGSRTFSQATPPASLGYQVADAPDFAVVGDVVHLVYAAASNVSTNVYLWRSDTTSSTPISSQGWAPQTDGVRVAWLDLAGTALNNFDLRPFYARSLAGGNTTVGSATANFVLRDGVLAWFDNSGLQVSTVTSTVTLSSASATAGLLGSDDGVVVYVDQGKVYSWNAATGRSTLRVDGLPGKPSGSPTPAFVTGNKLYFVVGDGQALYKLLLN